MSANKQLENIVKYVTCGIVETDTGKPPHARAIEKPINSNYLFYCYDSRGCDCPHHVSADPTGFCIYKPNPVHKE